MKQEIRISKSEQLEALAHGLHAFYRVIEQHIGGPIRVDFRQFATATKAELTEYLKNHPFLAERHVMSEEEALRLHDHPALLTENGKWVVCWMDRGTKTKKSYYNDLPEAAANFLMAYW